MTILTGIVLTIALGAVAQRGDVFQHFGQGSGLMPRDDVATLAAGEAYLIDVVANDRGAREDDGRRILIMTAPACGVTYRREGRIFYDAGPGCEGVQRITYCVARGDRCPAAEVTMRVSARTAEAASASGAPIEVLARAGDRIASADISNAPLASGFTAEPLLQQGGGALAGLASAFGTLAPAVHDEPAPAVR